MRQFLCAFGAAAMLCLAGAVHAQDRYVEPPPLRVSPDLSAPWVTQLQRAPAGAREPRAVPRGAARGYTLRVAPDPVRRRQARTPAPRPQAAEPRQRRQQPSASRDATRTSALAAGAARKDEPELAEKFMPQTVDYDGRHGAGTIVIDTNERFLYHVMKDGKARRYGVGVGKPGFEWAGSHKVTQKREWPDWRPPKQMIEREKKKGRVLPAHMEGGPANPLGARALYLGSTLYRIHGTNAPESIGRAVSSGCIRMRNEDVIDLYGKVGVGTNVVVI